MTHLDSSDAIVSFFMDTVVSYPSIRVACSVFCILKTPALFGSVSYDLETGDLIASTSSRYRRPQRDERPFP